ncbi:hypothetical protein SSCG_05663 [Streptomyces clavuligerus]|nr:hypothetical protein SSCG_05663 [Streptomyces clavuligerus]
MCSITTPGGYPMVQADKRDVEDLGLVKIDVLGVPGGRRR